MQLAGLFTQRDSAPRIVVWLGYGGLLPFVTLATASLFDPQRGGAWQQLLLNYGAVILSFVGALHWGFAMGSSAASERARTLSFVWSVVPALLAWLALLLDPLAGGALMAAGFGLHVLQDWRLAGQAALPAWYLPLRLRLSVVAAMSLLAAGWASRA